MSATTLNLFEFGKLVFKFRANPFHVHYLQSRRCLDIGCGAGSLLEKDPLNFVGLDLDKVTVTTAQEKGFQVFQGSATKLDMFEDGSFDVVNCSNLIEHFMPEDAMRLIDESSRVLKPGGYLLIETPSERIVWNTFSHVKPYPPSAIKKMLTNKTEAYLRRGVKSPALSKLTIDRVYYKGMSFSRLTYFLYLLAFNFTPLKALVRRYPPFCEGYLIVLKRG